ncbi:hypothetical protein PILCRDRAFT_817463 [Piloderma croceum F 1598]|uniref:UTP23 sensor motif region domain-containing protein n=1 Tax=Piloderma croceum (strain F 1598) TaxID=765440 RepID=A0A0C3G465_PILCF|nr:hypothetical protein PILCRDRAFT_817463 [Piloderma croceum F 1598]
MCKTATEHKLEFIKQLGIVLQGTVKPMITQCCIHELYLQGKLQQPAVDLAKIFERRKCNHREAISGDECLASVIGDSNKHRYVVATQSQSLRVKLRTIPAVPIVHVNRSVMVLEPASDTTLKIKETTEEQALYPTDLALVPPQDNVESLHRKKKGPKAPNPLSVKKKKAKVDEAGPFMKGKGKAKAGINSATDGERVGKRKRMDELERESDDSGIMKSGGGAHKRKRRRKRTLTNSPQVIDS